MFIMRLMVQTVLMSLDHVTQKKPDSFVLIVTVLQPMKAAVIMTNIYLSIAEPIAILQSRPRGYLPLNTVKKIL